MQQAIVLDVLRPKLLNNLRNIFFGSVNLTRTATGLRAYIDKQRRLRAEESEFCATIKSLLAHGVEADYLKNMLNDDHDAKPVYKQVYQNWVQAAIIQSGFASTLLGLKAGGPSNPMPPSAAHSVSAGQSSSSGAGHSVGDLENKELRRNLVPGSVPERPKMRQLSENMVQLSSLGSQSSNLAPLGAGHSVSAGQFSSSDNLHVQTKIMQEKKRLAALRLVGERWRPDLRTQDPTLLATLNKVQSSECWPLGTDLELHLWNPLRARLAASQSLTAEIFKQTMHEATTAFVTHCHEQSKVIFGWKDDPDQKLSHDQQRFLKKLPTNCIRSSFQGESQLAADARSVGNLCDAHGGELVHTATRSSFPWKLYFLLPGQSLADTSTHIVHKQFFYNQEGTVRSSGDVALELNEVQVAIVSAEIRRFSAEYDTASTMPGLQPNLQGSKDRLTMPCIDSADAFWGRFGLVCGLGEWFHRMSFKYDADTLYNAFLHKDLVSVKRFKDKPKRSSRGKRSSQAIQSLPSTR
jgi:hypothetical protein